MPPMKSRRCLSHDEKGWPRNNGQIASAVKIKRSLARVPVFSVYICQSISHSDYQISPFVPDRRTDASASVYCFLDLPGLVFPWFRPEGGLAPHHPPGPADQGSSRQSGRGRG